MTISPLRHGDGRITAECFQQSQTVAPAVSAPMRGWAGGDSGNAGLWTALGGGGQFAGGGNSAQFAGRAAERNSARRLQRGASGTAGSLPAAGAPIDWTSMMSYSPEPGTGEAWDPPGSLQPAANSGFPAGSGGTGGQGPGGVATSNPYSPVSTFLGRPGASLPRPGRAGAAIRAAGQVSAGGPSF